MNPRITEKKKNKSIRLLLVDDDPNMQRMVALFLRKGSFKLDIAGNGRIAIDRLGKEKYDLIISDMQMPLMDGSELIKKMRSNGIKTPVILISAYTSLDLPNEIEAGKFSDVLLKPFDSNKLITTINKVLKIKNSS